MPYRRPVRRIPSYLIRGSLPETDSVHPAQWLVNILGGPQSASGVNVTPRTAMQHVSIAAAIRVLAEDVAKLPLIAWGREGFSDGFEEPRWRRLYRHPILDVFQERPNPWQTPFGLKAFLTMSLAASGNAVALKQRRLSDNQLIGLIPIEPGRVSIHQVPGDPKLKFRISVGDEAAAAEAGVLRFATFDQDEVFWVQDSLSYAGLWGYSRVLLGQETVGTAMAQDIYTGTLFRQGARPPGALTTKEVLKPEARRLIAQEFGERYGGYQNAGKVPVLHSGLEFIQFGSTAREAQAVESQKWTVVQVAQMFRMPPSKLQHYEQTPFSTLAEQNRAYFDDTIHPLITNFEQAIRLQLTASEAKRQALRFDFDTAMFTRGRDEERWERLNKSMQLGAITANEWRRMADPTLPLLENDFRLIPVNTAVVEPDASVEDMRMNSAAAPVVPEPEPDGAEPPDDSAQRMNDAIAALAEVKRKQIATPKANGAA